MSQERWDVVLRFLDGPLSYQGDVVSRGPVVRMGASPGPGALVLDGYRGLDSVQATITAYDGGSVAITPMGTNQVRVAPHENVDWSEIQTLRGPVYLSPGDAFHLGSPSRGATVTFVECRKLGVWQKGRIISDAAQADGGIQPTNIRELDAQGGVPRWFVPAVLITAMLTMVGVLVPIVSLYVDPTVWLGDPVEGIEYVEYVTTEDLNNVEQSDLDGFHQAFDAFVMAPNAEAADREGLRDEVRWDKTFYRYVVSSTKLHRNKAFWRQLETVKDEYAYVTAQLRAAGLPTVFAAIPYQESKYRPNLTSPVCAKGYWQFMPETGHRYDLKISGCTLRNRRDWAPTTRAPPPGIFRNAEYVNYSEARNKASCAITSCTVDERVDLQSSTRAAILMLQESWDHERTQESGAGVQMTILAHNMGFDDNKYLKPGSTKYGILAAYSRYTRKIDRDFAPDFYGANITCDPSAQDPHKPNTTSTRCGGFLPNQTQHYGYNIVAQHLLAVCYYATNYGDEEVFKDWTQYTFGDGYCTQLSVPESGTFREDG